MSCSRKSVTPKWRGAAVLARRAEVAPRFHENYVNWLWHLDAADAVVRSIKGEHSQEFARCPLRRRKQTSVSACGKSALCNNQTSSSTSFDRLVGDCKQA
jgi:hypothetical protein